MFRTLFTPLVVMYCSQSVACGQSPSVSTGQLWKIKGDTAKGRDLSAAARLSEKWCAVASDETDGVQMAEIDAAETRLKVKPLVSLLPAGLEGELDAEGLAWSPSAACLYVTGSHAMARVKSEIQDTRHWVVKVPVDPATGEVSSAKIERVSMDGLIKKNTVLAPFFDKPLQRKGFNFEGLAEKDGELYFGVRGPNLAGKVSVLQVNAARLFADAAAAPVTHHQVAIGAGWGIREIVAVSGGFLIIVGNAGAEPNEEYPETIDWEKGRGSEFWWWKGPSADPAPAVKIGPVPMSPNQSKAEGFLVLSDTQTTLKGLIFFDGEKEGGPTEVTLTKP